MDSKKKKAGNKQSLQTQFAAVERQMSTASFSVVNNTQVHADAKKGTLMISKVKGITITNSNDKTLISEAIDKVFANKDDGVFDLVKDFDLSLLENQSNE